MTVALSNSEDGEPVGASNSETVALVRTPNGVKPHEWSYLIECCVGIFRATAGHGVPSRRAVHNIDIDDVLSDQVISTVFDYPANLALLERALVVRGVLPLGKGLSAQQMLALEIISDPMQGPMSTRLRKANVTKSQFEKWLEHKPFAEQLQMLGKKRLNQAQPLVDIELTRNALDGQLDSIKYFDKRVGRDPDKRAELDGNFVVAVVIDALTKHLSEQPDLLRNIAAEIEVRLKLNVNEHD